MNSMNMRYLPFVLAASVCMTVQSTIHAQCDPEQVAKLLAGDRQEYDHFGNSVAVDGEVAIIGVPGDDDLGTDSGSAYIYRFTGSSWIQEEKLLATDGQAGDAFGRAVAVDGGVALVGASHDDDLGSNSGAAYVFRFDGKSWVQDQKLHASNGDAGEMFGSSVGVSEGVVVIGVPADDDLGTTSGSAYVFRFNGSSWNQEQKILASDGEPDDRFGGSVAVSTGVAIIGTQWHDRGYYSGAAYVYRFNGASWVEEQKLVPSDNAGDRFGKSVSIGEGIAVIGAYFDGDRENFARGAAYVFRWNGLSWDEEQKLLASDGQGFDEFGYSVALSGDVAVIGANRASGGRPGAAYVFRFNRASWVQENRLLASDGRASDYFGWCVAVNNDVAVVGAYEAEARAGATYIFNLNCGPQLNVTASCPSGGPIQISWSGATGGGRIRLLYARHTGNFTIPNGHPCAGARLHLKPNEIEVVYHGGAGPDGSRTLNGNADQSACGGYLQLLDVSTCTGSNVVQLQ